MQDFCISSLEMTLKLTGSQHWWIPMGLNMSVNFMIISSRPDEAYAHHLPLNTGKRMGA